MTIGTTTFSAVSSALVLLFSPIDGTLISGAQIAETFPCGVVAEAAATRSVRAPIGTVPSGAALVCPGAENQPLFLAAIDGTSKPAGLAGLGTTAGAQPYGIAMDPSGAGRIFVAAQVEMATTSTVGPIAAGQIIAVFGPDPCVTGAGPQGSMTGDPSNHGDLPPNGSPPVTQPDSRHSSPVPRFIRAGCERRRVSRQAGMRLWQRMLHLHSNPLRRTVHDVDLHHARHARSGLSCIAARRRRDVLDLGHAVHVLPYRWA